MVINVAKSNVMRISRQPSPVLNMKRQKQLKYVGSLITDDARLHVKLNPGMPWQRQHSTRGRFFSSANRT
jgi:hypothetical protein